MVVPQLGAEHLEPTPDWFFGLHVLAFPRHRFGRPSAAWYTLYDLKRTSPASIVDFPRSPLVHLRKSSPSASFIVDVLAIHPQAFSIYPGILLELLDPSSIVSVSSSFAPFAFLVVSSRRLHRRLRRLVRSRSSSETLAIVQSVPFAAWDLRLRLVCPLRRLGLSLTYSPSFCSVSVAPLIPPFNVFIFDVSTCPPTRTSPLSGLGVCSASLPRSPPPRAGSLG